jgi:MoxR-like ATPase
MTEKRRIYQLTDSPNPYIYCVFDITDPERTPIDAIDFGIPVPVLKNAQKHGWLIEIKKYKSGSKIGKDFYAFVKDRTSVAHLYASSNKSNDNNLNHAKTKEVKLNLNKNNSPKTFKDYLNEVESVDTSELKSHSDIVKFIAESPKYKPSFLKISDFKWKSLVRAVLKGENIIVTGKHGEGKTVSAYAVAKVLNRPIFPINFGNMKDAQTALIGKTHLDPKLGTFFSKSYFVEGITTPNAIILLDEFNRSNDDAMNILFSVLDKVQRYLRLDDDVNSPKIEVAPGVCFIATANIGRQYTGTRTIDDALFDRFSIKIEVDNLSVEDRTYLIKTFYPSLDTNTCNLIAKIADKINSIADESDSMITLSKSVSTRTCLNMADMLVDGFTLEEALELNIYNDFSAEGGVESERVAVKQLVQGIISPNQK